MWTPIDMRPDMVGPPIDMRPIWSDPRDTHWNAPRYGRTPYWYAPDMVGPLCPYWYAPRYGRIPFWYAPRYGRTPFPPIDMHPDMVGPPIDMHPIWSDPLDPYWYGPRYGRTPIDMHPIWSDPLTQKIRHFCRHFVIEREHIPHYMVGGGLGRVHSPAYGRRGPWTATFPRLWS